MRYESGAVVGSLDGGLAVLDMFRTCDRVSTADVARELGVGRSTAHRWLRTLESHGYVVLSSTGRGYLCGVRLLDAGFRPDSREDRVKRRTVVQRVRERTGESVHSAVLVGSTVLVTDGRRSMHQRDIGVRRGMTAPAYAMAAGKLLLSAYDDRQVTSLFPGEALAPSAPGTLRTVSALLRELSAIRGDGFSVAVQESEPGVCSIAVPLDGHHWRERCALVVSVPIERVGPGRLDAIREQAADSVRACAQAGIVSPW